jgi:hypothetical protein
MGTSLDALNAGSLTYKYIVAIEGYSRLLTSAAPASAVTAWSGTDWSQALGGLFVEMDNQGSAHPWEPFQPGGLCTLRVMDADGTDQFGIDTHRKLAGAETTLAATADRNDTTITVVDTSTFAASGEAFVGTECFGYSGKTATTFTGATRGKYSPFTSGTGARWSEHHRQGQAANRVALSPVVSAQPRVWLGKWVAVWIHRDIGGVLDVKAQAQLVYAGKIVEIRDDPTGFTVVQLKHVMDTLGEAMLGRDQWMAKVIEGVYVRATETFSILDYTNLSPVTQKTGTNLTCVASGATGTNQLNEGYYTTTALLEIVNSWLRAELAAGRIYGSYSLASPVGVDNGMRTRFYYQIPNAGNTIVAFQLKVPLNVALLLGFTDTAPALQARTANSFDINTPSGSRSNTALWLESKGAPLRAILTHWGTSVYDLRMGLFDEVGTFFNQFETLPIGSQPKNGDLGLDWGIFSFNDANYMVAAKDDGELRYIVPASGFYLPGNQSSSAPWSGALQALTVSYNQPAEILVKQVATIELEFGDLLKSIFYSSGTAGFNSASWDTFAYGLGLGIPGSLLGASFEASIDALAGAGLKTLLVIDKPTRLSDLISSDLVLRWAFPRWKQGTLSFATWKVPAEATGPTLTESTKARPAGSRGDERTPTATGEEWRHDIVTIQYNRDALSKEDYLSFLTFEDAAQVDDSGGEGKPITIKARNTYSQFNNTGAGVEGMAPNFLAQFPIFSRPLRKQTLSISPALYEQLAPGDFATVSDSFARDPATGLRRIFARAALVIRVRSNRGGAQPGNPRGIAPQGEVDVMYAPDGARFAAYSYTATVDETVTGGGFTAGYNSGTLTLRCKAHDNSETSEAVDASRFINGDKIVIIERDPANAASPLSWSRTVTGTPVGNDIVINSALAAPAFDGAKRYRIIYDHYTALQATQQVLAAQADVADSLIENAAAPFHYTETQPSSTAFTIYDPTIPVEMIPDASYGDGKALDVGHEFALIHLAHVLEDYRTAHHTPIMFDDVVIAIFSGTYQMVAMWPVHLTASTLETRSIAVAPLFRSFDGSSASVRVSLCRYPPAHSNPSFGNPNTIDITRPAVLSETTFTTTSTSFSTPSAHFLDESVKNWPADFSIAWVLVEINTSAEIKGLSRFDQGARQ